MRNDPCRLLDTGDQFPPMDIPTVQGDRIILPDYFTGHWNVFLIYRGHW